VDVKKLGKVRILVRILHILHHFQKLPQKKYRHKKNHLKIFFKALCSQVIFQGSKSKAPFGFPFWTFIFVQNQKPKIPFKSIFFQEPTPKFFFNIYYLSI